jgi:hypothetical protein
MNNIISKEENHMHQDIKHMVWSNDVYRNISWYMKRPWET